MHVQITQHYSFKQFQWTPSTSAKQTVKEQATLSSGNVLAMDALEVKVTVASSRGLGPDFPAQASIVFTPSTGQSVSFALAPKGEGVLSAYIPADKLRALVRCCHPPGVLRVDSLSCDRSRMLKATACLRQRNWRTSTNYCDVPDVRDNVHVYCGLIDVRALWKAEAMPPAELLAATRSCA